MENLFSNSIGASPARIVQDLCVGGACGMYKMGSEVEGLSENLHTGQFVLFYDKCLRENREQTQSQQ